MHGTHMIANEALITFLTVQESRTLGAAADRLHLSQPAVSRRLQTLEAAVGAPLFERTRRGLRLTSLGEVLLTHAERVRAVERDAERALADHLGRPSGAVRLAIVGSLAGAWFSTALARVRSEHPAVDVIVSTGTSREIWAHVARGDAVAGVTYRHPDGQELRSRLLFRERLVLVCHPAHALAGRTDVDIGHLDGEAWLLFPEWADEPESSDAAARRLLRQHGVPAERLRAIDSLTAQRALAASGYGLAFLPAGTAGDAMRSGELGTIGLRGDPVTSPVYVVTRREGYLSPAARVAIESLTSEAAEGVRR